MSNHKSDICVVLDNIRSAGNVGAIFRTCDGAGVKKLYLCGITALPAHPEVIKTALGADKSVDWQHFEQTTDAIKELQQDGYQIIAVEQASESVDFANFQPTAKVAYIFGHEREGVSKDALKLAEVIIEIKLSGTIKSLNVATSVGVILFCQQKKG